MQAWPGWSAILYYVPNARPSVKIGWNDGRPLPQWRCERVQFSAVGKSDHRRLRDKCFLCQSKDGVDSQQWKVGVKLSQSRQPWKVNTSGNPEKWKKWCWIQCKSEWRWRLLGRMSSCWGPNGDWSLTRGDRTRGGYCSGQGMEYGSNLRVRSWFRFWENVYKLGMHSLNIKNVVVSNLTV